MDMSPKNFRPIPQIRNSWKGTIFFSSNSCKTIFRERFADFAFNLRLHVNVNMGEIQKNIQIFYSPCIVANFYAIIP